jgi:hypothetical protein
MLPCAEKATDELTINDGDEQDDLRKALAEVHTTLDDICCVQDNMCAVQQKLRELQFEHGQCNGLLRAARDELCTSQLAFALVHLSYKDVLKALCQIDKLPAPNDKRHALEIAYTLARNVHTMAQKAYGEAYVRVQDAEKAVLLCYHIKEFRYKTPKIVLGPKITSSNRSLPHFPHGTI